MAGTPAGQRMQTASASLVTRAQVPRRQPDHSCLRIIDRSEAPAIARPEDRRLKPACHQITGYRRIQGLTVCDAG